MKKIYSDYFQKSKVFLYPLLGIKKGIRFVPLETYLNWDGYFKSDNDFFCLYNIPQTTEEKKMFEVFKQLHLKTNEHFIEWFSISNDKNKEALLLCHFKFDMFKCTC